MTPNKDVPMHRLVVGAAFAATIAFGGPAMAQERIRITSEWGEVTAELNDNAAARSLLNQLPVTIRMRDHLRQEKTGNLPAPLPEIGRQRDFAVGTLGLWNSDHFVIYYRGGRVPSPGIIELGRVTGDIGMFDRPGSVEIRIERLP
jgi:hypothetical protein